MNFFAEVLSQLPDDNQVTVILQYIKEVDRKRTGETFILKVKATRVFGQQNVIDSFARISQTDVEEALRRDGIDLTNLIAPIKYHDSFFNSWVDLDSQIDIRYPAFVDQKGPHDGPQQVSLTILIQMVTTSRLEEASGFINASMNQPFPSGHRQSFNGGIRSHSSFSQMSPRNQVPPVPQSLNTQLLGRIEALEKQAQEI